MSEAWQDLIAWGDELYDPIFQGDDAGLDIPPLDDSFTANYHVPESCASDQAYQVSAPPSIADGPPSLEYTVSAPPSVGQPLSNTTSPLLGHEDGRYFGSFGSCDNVLTPLERISESPILDTRFERISDTFGGAFGVTTNDTVFNPYVAGSAHSFSGLDVRTSQVFSNVGTWADQPQILEPTTELDESTEGAAPISIPQPSLPSAGYFLSDGSTYHSRRVRSVTIPDVARSSYTHGMSRSGYSPRVTPLLSVSPVSQRRRGVTMSRTLSNSRRKTSTPSPTSAASDSYGWVSYQPNPVTNKLAPINTEGFQGRTPRGRKKGLTAEQRSHAALMRIIGACTNCQKRKEKCDPGTPCKSCLEHYKGDLVNHPCRDRRLSDLSSAFLSDRLGWHPTARSLESFIGQAAFEITTGITYMIPLNFGFGPSLSVPVNAIQIEDNRAPVHEHAIYSWPPDTHAANVQTHAVLPACLTEDAQSRLMHTLDAHLSLLVKNHFRAFPLFCSPLRILKEVYIFSRVLPPNAPHANTLHQALKLLVLVHVGGDITLPPRSENPVLAQLIRATIDNGNAHEHINPTPCFIRAQFGEIMPSLALRYMRDVLTALEHLLLDREPTSWPIALAILMTVLMTVESIHYHAAKKPYHTSLDNEHDSDTDTENAQLPRTNPEEDLRVDDEGVKALLNFYTACFGGCHARLRPDWEGEVSASSSSSSAQGQHQNNTQTPEDAFVESVRSAIKEASRVGYLSPKSNAARQGDDMGFFFDRLVARLLLLKV